MSSQNILVAVGFSVPPTILTVIGNTVFLITLLKTASLHTPSNALLGALCVTDLLVGLLCQPMHITVLLSKPGPCCPPLIKAFNFIYYWSCWNSFFYSLLITLDRYAAICYPYKYRQLARCRKYIYLTLSIFIFFAVHSAIRLLFYKKSEISFISVAVGLELVIIITVVVIYVKIYKIAFWQRRRTVVSVGDIDGRQRSPISTKEKSRTHTVAIILGVFVICYIPYTVFGVHRILYYLRKMDYNVDFGIWANYLVLFNSCLNPIIYCARSQEIRSAAIRIFISRNNYGSYSTRTTADGEQINSRRATQRFATTQF